MSPPSLTQTFWLLFSLSFWIHVFKKFFYYYFSVVSVGSKRKNIYIQAAIPEVILTHISCYSRLPSLGYYPSSAFSACPSTLAFDFFPLTFTGHYMERLKKFKVFIVLLWSKTSLTILILSHSMPKPIFK